MKIQVSKYKNVYGFCRLLQYRLLDLALLARYLLYSCIRTGVQVLFSNNYFNQLPVWVKHLNL